MDTPRTDRRARNRETTRPILPSDMGRRTDDLDLALVYDPVTKLYTRR